MPNFRKSTLIRQLKNISAEDLDAFSEYISSSNLKIDKKLPIFLKEICVFYPDFKDELFTSGNIYRTVYPAKAFDYQNFKNLRNELLTLLKIFIAKDKTKPSEEESADIETTKLISILKKIPSSDLKELEKFLHSPYHNSTKKLPDFFEILCKYYPKFKNRNCTMVKIYNKLYPGEAYVHTRFRWLMNELINRIDDYFAHEELKKNQILKNQLSHKGFMEIGYGDKFRIDAGKRITVLESKDVLMNPADYKYLMETYLDLFHHMHAVQKSRIVEGYIVSVMENLDCFFFLSKITHSLYLLTENNIRAKSYDIKLLDEALALGKKTILNENTLFKLYTFAIELLQQGKEEVYFKLKSILFDENNPVAIPKTGKDRCAIILINFAITKQNDGDASFLKELFELSRFREEHKLLLDDGRIMGHTYLNVIISALACEEFEWVNDFIQKYSGNIRPDEKEDTLNLERAYVFFFKKDYRQTMESLSIIKDRDFVFKVRRDSLSIRAFYETFVQDHTMKSLLKGKINSFTKDLKKQAINSGIRTAYLNFAEIVLDMVKFRNRIKKLIFKSKLKKVDLKKQVSIETAAWKAEARQKMKRMRKLKFRIWLQEKVEEL